MIWSSQLYERSRFASEVGAAIKIGPNATPVLAHYGFDFERAGAIEVEQVRSRYENYRF